MMRWRGAVTALLILGGCDTAPPASFPPLSFADDAPITLSIARVEVEDAYEAPLQRPNVEHLAPIPPALGLKQWAEARLRGGGPTGSARFIIDEASIIETELPRTEGLQAVIRIDQAERHAIRLVGRIVASDPMVGLESVVVTAVAERSMTLAENATLAEREQLWFDLLQGAIADFEPALRATLARDTPALLR